MHYLTTTATLSAWLQEAAGWECVSLSRCRGLCWVIHGQEEVGSPYAHKLYPTVEFRSSLPPIGLWLEETGYFEKDGTQRLLRRCDTRRENGVCIANGCVLGRLRPPSPQPLPTLAS